MTNLAFALIVGLTVAVCLFCTLASLFVPTFFKALRNAFSKPLGVLLLLGVAALTTAAATQIDLTANVRGLLPGTNGGTGISSTATYPASGTIMTTTTGVAAAQLPNPSATTLGGVESLDCTGSGHIVKISTSGVPTCAADAAGPNFADNETPSGTINGVTTSFTLAHAPSPALSLSCFENGVEQRAAGADFTLSSLTITYGVAPPTGTTLVCSYRW
jgi:hypothetical protein